VLARIEAAKAQSDDVAHKIVALAERTQAIGEIVGLISDIAEQTNLLALNAAIEASRAGEHGLGFAVVASEVKALADESKKATRRVRDILGDIQKMANVSVLSTEEGTRSMVSATGAAGVAGETIRSFEQVVAEVAQAAEQIAAAAGQQALGLSQIQQAMRDVNQVSAQNLASTHQAHRAATELSELGQRLQELAV
jgi:methyl-accepting chemotaxis protein